MAEYKIGLIIDKSRAYNIFQRDRLLRQWGVTSEMDRVNDLSNAGGVTLFGDTPAIELHLGTIDEVKKAVFFIERRSPEDLVSLYPNSLIITCEVARTSTKKLEGYFKKHGLTLLTPPTQKEGSVTEKLLDELNLRPNVKRFILEYVGEEYENILSLVESLSSIPRSKHLIITEEDIMIRFPQEKGSLPAWDVEQHVLNGDVKSAVETARRVGATTFWLTVLRNKLLTYHRVANVLAENPNMKDDDVVKLFGLPARGFYYTKKTVKTFPVNSFEKALELVMIADGNIKGGSSAPSTALSEELLVKLCQIFKKK